MIAVDLLDLRQSVRSLPLGHERRIALGLLSRPDRATAGLAGESVDLVWAA